MRKQLFLSLTPNAPVRLEALLKKHEVTGHANTYNGTAMWKELLTLKTADSLTSERIDHDRVLENMRDNVLADGCSAQEYSHRVKTLQRWHIPHLQRPFATDESLAEFLIDLMPEKNGHEGRDLKRRLKTAGTLTSVTAVAESHQQPRRR